MALDRALVGRSYPPSAVYEVGRAKLAEFAAAIGDDDPVYRDADAARAAGHPDVIAPPTFAITVSLEAAFVVRTIPTSASTTAGSSTGSSGSPTTAPSAPVTGWSPPPPSTPPAASPATTC